MFKKILTLLLLSIVGIGGSLFIRRQNPPFESLGKEEMYQRIVAERDFAIQKAVEKGEYKCCISPPCTMCYMEANQWNNFKPGTCVCDDLIAQGKDPCSQCERGLCEKDKKGTCKVN